MLVVRPAGYEQAYVTEFIICVGIDYLRYIRHFVRMNTVDCVSSWFHYYKIRGPVVFCVFWKFDQKRFHCRRIKTTSTAGYRQTTKSECGQTRKATVQK